MNVLDSIGQQMADNAIILYMKGTPERPQCGFSARAVKCLQDCGVEFASVDVLNPDIRESLSKHSGWPTFPQFFINGELIGGSDILVEMHDSGELEPLLRSAINQDQGDIV